MTTPMKTAEISTQLKATLLGAGLGGAVGGLGDWLSRDENSPDSSWDGILSGAARGGYLGNRGALLGGYLGRRESSPAENNDNSSAGAAANGTTATLASQLPPGYRAEAKSLAEAYRKLHPDIDWKQQITDKALDRKVPVDYGNVSKSISSSLAAQASYNPNTDRIQLKDPSDTLALPHELTHAAQTHSSIREDAERLARQVIGNMPQWPRTPTGKPLIFEKTISFSPFASDGPPLYKDDCLPDPPVFNNPFAWDGKSARVQAQAELIEKPDPQALEDCLKQLPKDSIEAESARDQRLMDQWGSSKTGK